MGSDSRDHAQKYITPAAGTSTTLGWFRRDLEMKADRAWVEAKLESLRSAIETSDERTSDTKIIAIKAKEIAGMPHDCSQRDAIARLSNAVDGWSRWWRGILLSFLGVTITAGGSGLYQYFNLSSAVEGTRASIVNLDKTVTEIEESQKELKRTVEGKFQSDSARLDAHLRNVTDAVTQAVIDSNKRGSN